MGLIFNRRKKLGKNTTLNVGKKSASVSRKLGPVTVNSRGGVSVKLGKGARYKLK